MIPTKSLPVLRDNSKKIQDAIFLRRARLQKNLSPKYNKMTSVMRYIA